MVLLGLAAGCMNQQLRFTTRRTANTLPDLQYQQILDNLAMIAFNPGFLPYLAVAGQGSIQVTDSATPSLSLTMAPKTFTSAITGLNASRNVTGTWSLGTITSPEKIRGMQRIYRTAVRESMGGGPASAWLKTGCKRDVPRDACYVSRYGRMYVWVLPTGIEGLSDLTLAIMDVATREDSGPAPSHSAIQPRESSPEPYGSAAPAPMRRNFQVPAIGPVFTPGAR
jgi:hypothetical protein